MHLLYARRTESAMSGPTSSEVDLRPVKAMAAKLLPLDDPQRASLTSLADWLPREEALVVIRFYVRYFAELRERRQIIGQ